ncbi:hypothetical protein RchiOBHm_Chr7g0210391 [Rosa chinensis]|uniref:Uncharacterized protein n=1 Tax=Rosa chinensis TaxID=74649 RepID=A0A2P6PA74_ROSCH|nr:hypothetical protein RchiOBHm_Chr7g0210391 [Rosa chinensis]
MCPNSLLIDKMLFFFTDYRAQFCIWVSVYFSLLIVLAFHGRCILHRAMLARTASLSYLIIL